MDEDKRLSYFFLGLGIGVAVGILFAPKAGDETRGLIRNKAGEGADYVKRRSGELKESASELVERSKSAVARQKEQLASALEAGKSAYRETVSSTGSSES
jgi:gas vesicle protein